MRNVIYKNGDLQQELFRQYRNPAIGNAKRQQVLQKLESQVAAFFNRGRQAQPAAQPTAGTEVPPAAQPAAAPQTTQQPRRPRFQLPERKPAAPQPAAPAQARPQVTGALTKGGEGGGEPDPSALADSMFKQLYGQA
jgi:hypothetical protein